MKNKISITIIILAMIITVLTIFLLRRYSESPAVKISCIEPKINLAYNACYDVVKNSISLKITNNENVYNLKKISIEFRDDLTSAFQVTPLPSKGSAEQYTFNSKKNPVKLSLNIGLENTPSEICSESTKVMLLKDCDSKDISINLSISDNSSANIPKSAEQSSAANALPAIIGKSGLPSVSCKSYWTCAAWEECINKIQRRECLDLSKCPIPTDPPYFARFCNNSCKENWQCEWGQCINGYTQPSCKDLSNCSTEYSKPSSILCNKNTACAPKIYCSDWSDCSINCKFEDLLLGIEELRGKKSRYCIDSNKCILPVIEESGCSIKVDIMTKEVNICGKTYLEIRDKLTGKILSRVDYSKISDKLDINLFFSEEPTTVC